MPDWYWWAVGALMVVLAAGVDIRTSAALGTAVPVFAVGLLGFVALIVGGTLGIAFALRAAGVRYPATLACAAGGIAMGLGGPVLMRTLRRIMLGNRAGSPR